MVAGIDVAPPGYVLNLSAVRAKVDAVGLRRLTSRFELLLEQAEGFARGGDYLGGQARARYAHDALALGARSAALAEDDIVELRRHLELRLRHYDLLARDWQQGNVARHAAYLAREREAIGASVSPASDPGVRRTGVGNVLRRLWTGAFGRFKTGTMRLRNAP